MDWLLKPDEIPTDRFYWYADLASRSARYHLVFKDRGLPSGQEALGNPALPRCQPAVGPEPLAPLAPGFSAGNHGC